MLNAVQILTLLVGVVVFCGSILDQETQNTQQWSSLSQEPFAAIGPWGNLAVVILVLVAAGIH